MHSYLRSLALVAGATLAGAGHAGVIVNSAGQFDAAIAAFDPIGQSFVAEDGTIDAIAFAFSDINPTGANNPVVMTLFQGGGFGGSVIASRTLTLPAVLPSTLAAPVFFDFDFGGTSLTVGQTYTAAVTTGLSFKVGVVYSSSNPFAGGQAYITGSLSGCSNPADCDLNFRVTPGEANNGVPEPGTLALAGLALGLMASFGRRGKARRSNAA